MNDTKQNESMKNLRLEDLLKEDHDQLDGLFSSFRQAKEEDPDLAGRLLNQFARELRHHIEWENDELFPRYEEQVEPPGITRRMRADHREILRITEKIQDRWSNGYRSETSWNAGRLRSILDRHNAREENQLYPELNDLLSSDEKRRIAEQFREKSNKLND